jgi:hypothetical protein
MENGRYHPKCKIPLEGPKKMTRGRRGEWEPQILSKL